MWTESRQVLEVEIQAAKAQSHQSWQPDLASDESRLQARLEKLKLDMQVVQGDGNCQVRESTNCANLPILYPCEVPVQQHIMGF